MSAAAIPYEKQLDSQTGRTCGAACLSMVYRSLGKAVPQTEIWPAIAKQTASGSLASMTHLMAQDAVNRGFRAVAIQARHPLQVLRLCREWGIRAIVNHHLKLDAPAGHYSVLVDLDDKGVVLHDPFYGPSRRLPHAELLELWPQVARRAASRVGWQDSSRGGSHLQRPRSGGGPAEAAGERRRTQATRRARMVRRVEAEGGIGR